MKKTTHKIFTKEHRVLHWSLAILLTVSFVTGFLRMVWMSKASVVSAVQQNSNLPTDQAIAIYKTLRAPMWQFHLYAAYIIVFIFILRMLYMIVEGIRFPNPFAKEINMRQRLRGWVYIVFYAFITIQIITGLGMKLSSGDIKETLETIHKLAIYWFPLFIILHFGGIVIAELTREKGIVSKMIGGD